ncbi:hypothetical protein AV530_004602 [Patagioenas fasciata monilis]|uniref:Uncharacterized protein n=1 Tax=Patagioenas fasciata monilis TaxID=372326 RepID=A0A1V4KJA8_PATFA|nr:hypothetical protein AV530_004602 [Patagioenas fasciata monilis]
MQRKEEEEDGEDEEEDEEDEDEENEEEDEEENEEEDEENEEEDEEGVATVFHKNAAMDLAGSNKLSFLCMNQRDFFLPSGMDGALLMKDCKKVTHQEEKLRIIQWQDGLITTLEPIPAAEREPHGKARAGRPAEPVIVFTTRNSCHSTFGSRILF